MSGPVDRRKSDEAGQETGFGGRAEISSKLKLKEANFEKGSASL